MKEALMKALLLAIALVSGFAFMTASVFANPATLPKHPGYPDESGKATTATGEAANLKSQEDAPKQLKQQIRESSGGVPDQGQLKRTEDSRVPTVVGPGHVGGSKGVSENMLKEATKVNANPK
jgi:hypothetical protein